MAMTRLGASLRDDFNDRIYWRPLKLDERVVKAPYEGLEEGLDWRLRDRLCWCLNTRLNGKICDRLADRLADRL